MTSRIEQNGIQQTGPDWYLITPQADEIVREAGISLLDRGEPGVRDVPGDCVGFHHSHLPLIEAFVEALTEASTEANANLAAIASMSPPTSHVEASVKLSTKLPAWWVEELKDYQLDAVREMRGRSGTLLLDDLGAGKTRTLLAAADYPAVVFMPKSVLMVWEEECEYAQLRHRSLGGRAVGGSSFDDAENVDVWLVPWSVAGSWAGYFSSVGAGPRVQTKIGDEFHEIQRERTQAARAWNVIDCERRFGATATGLRNRLRSLWSLLNGVQPKAWGSLYDFRKRYCGATQGEFGLVDGRTDPLAMHDLRLRLQEVVIKRSREELGLDLVPHERDIYEVRLYPEDRATVFEEIQEELVVNHFRREGSKASGVQLAMLGKWRSKLGEVKARRVIPKIVNLLNEWRRAVVWVWHKDVASILEHKLLAEMRQVEVVKILGSSTSKARRKVLEDWKYGDPFPKVPHVLIAAIGACSTGVSFLTCGLNVFVEQDWAPLQMVQAEKRTHRPFQRHPRCLSVYVTTGEGTVDHLIAQALLEKAKEAEMVLGRDGQLDQIKVLIGNDFEKTDAEFMATVGERMMK